jgi:hypothetical protein
MRKPALIIFSLLSFSYIAFSQIILKRSVQWNEPAELFSPNMPDEIADKKLILYFQNALYRDTDKPLPYFHELIRVDNPSGNFSVRIENPVFTDLTREESLALDNVIHIDTEITPESRLMFQRKNAYLNIEFIPLRRNSLTQKFEKLLSFEIHISSVEIKSTETFSSNKAYATNSILSTGNWVKIRVETDGIYQITWTELQAMGFQNPSNIRVFGNGNEMLSLMNNEPKMS